MKIRVAYSELKSGPGFNNKKAEAELEVDVTGNIDNAFQKAWEKVRAEVERQLEDYQPPF
ncbi:MAG TPA: hypothetical protein GXX35_11340 [Thermoanaerobacterales bacterium]|nr:hypothetical protein [Thermoanaerobacterales bacterium]